MTKTQGVDVYVSGEGLVRMTADEARRYRLAMAKAAQRQALAALASRLRS